MTEQPLHWVDGVRGAQVPADDRGLLYADGVFRTLRVDDGVADDLSGQLSQLAADATLLGLPEINLEHVQTEISAAAAAVGQGVVRITLTRGSGGQGYDPAGAVTVRRIIIARPLPQDDEPQRLALLPPSPVLTTNPGKHLNRLAQVQAAQLVPAWASAGLLQNPDACLVCATQSNIFAIDEAERLITPPASDGALTGRMRARVLEAAAGAGLAVRQQSIPAGDLGRLAGMFSANSVRGLQWIAQVSDLQRKHIAGWPAQHAAFSALQSAIKHPAHRAGY